MSLLRNEYPMSSTSSVASCSSSINEPLPPNKYLMKTLCFCKKSMVMPTKEEYAKLLNCGLGARKWQVNLDLDAKSFQLTLLNIYPRLSSAPTYSLWTINKDKSFEKLPQKVDAPSRIRAYLGSQFSGCLVIMPSEEISLSPSPNVNGVETDVGVRNAYKPTNRDRLPRIANPFELGGPHLQNGNRYSSPSANSGPSHSRSICLLCGRMAKQLGSSAFYNIETHMLKTEGGGTTIANRLREIIRVQLPRKKLIASEEICKKCFRQLNEIDYLENQVKNAKDDVVNNFFHTVAKISRMDPHVLHQNGINPRHHSHIHSQSSGASSISSGFVEADQGSLSSHSTDFTGAQRVYLQPGEPAPYHGALMTRGPHSGEAKADINAFPRAGLNLVPVNLNYQSSASAVAAVMAAAAATKQPVTHANSAEARQKLDLVIKTTEEEERLVASHNATAEAKANARSQASHVAGRTQLSENQRDARGVVREELMCKPSEEDEEDRNGGDGPDSRENDQMESAQDLSRKEDLDEEDESSMIQEYYGSLWHRHLKQKALAVQRALDNEADNPEPVYLSYNRVLRHYKHQLSQNHHERRSTENLSSDRSTSESQEGDSSRSVSPRQSYEPLARKPTQRRCSNVRAALSEDQMRPWKKRYRERTDEATTEPSGEPEAKSYRHSSSPGSANSSNDGSNNDTKPGQNGNNSNTDSGVGGSDEDSAGSNSNGHPSPMKMESDPDTSKPSSIAIKS